jgi:hypothetical protein
LSHSLRFGAIFLLWVCCGEDIVFTGGFCEKEVQDVVFLWTDCGGSRGKSGEGMVGFLG